MLRVRAVLAAASCVVLTASVGCARQAEPTTKERMEQIPGVISIELSGDLEGKAENHTTKTQVISLESNDPEREGHRMYGIETVDPIRVGKASVSAGFAVLPYEGARKYTIKAGSIYDAAAPGADGQAQGASSSVKVLWRPDADVEEIYDFFRREEPCRVEIEKGGNEGQLSCPKLTDEARSKHFSLKIRWKFAPASAEQQTDK